MKFNKQHLALLAFAFPVLAAATPTMTYTGPAGSTSTEPASQCSTGSIQCCNTVTDASNPAVAGILGLLDIVIQDVGVIVGLACSLISVIGTGSSSCSAQLVCCDDNSYGGLISIGCVPVTVGL